MLTHTVQITNLSHLQAKQAGKHIINQTAKLSSKQLNIIDTLPLSRPTLVARTIILKQAFKSKAR